MSFDRFMCMVFYLFYRFAVFFAVQCSKLLATVHSVGVHMCVFVCENVSKVYVC